MRFQIILMCGGAIVAIVALLLSRFARAVFRETILRPHQHCEIQVHPDKVLVKKIERS